jgi:hypothetical protein
MAGDMSDSKSSRAGRILRRPVNENFVTLNKRRPKRRCNSPPCLVPQVSNMSDSDSNDSVLGASAKRMRGAHNIAHQSPFATQPSAMVTDQFTEPDYRVALDFGTTYTSIAFVRKGEREINTIDQWDGDRCHHSNGRQVPTESVYRPASRLHGYEAQRWLEESQPDDAVIAHIKRMKLLLDDTGCVWTQDAKSEVAKGIQKLQAHHLIDSEQDIIRHILKYYFRHIKRTLEMAEGFHDGNSGT